MIGTWVGWDLWPRSEAQQAASDQPAVHQITANQKKAWTGHQKHEILDDLGDRSTTNGQMP